MPEITFQRLTQDDLPMMHAWLNNPDVARWYGVGDDNHGFPSMDEVIAEYAENFERQVKNHAFIIHLGGKPVGYIQCYRLGDYPDYAKTLEEDPDAWAIDIFVGEDDARSRGIGPLAIQRLLDEVIFSRPEVAICFICPDPDNKRAVRAYEKAGFRYVKTVWIPDEAGYESVMRIDRS